jgi:hypothetical protein
MNHWNGILQGIMRVVLAILLTSPLSLLIASSGNVNPHDIASMINLWCVAAVAYSAGFWLTFFLIRRGSLQSRSIGLWCLSLVFGLFTALFVPIGTILALPCLVTMFWRWKIYFHSVRCLA